ncbi:MAG: hypothetical protein ACK5MI_05120 [Mangrovibacterium sp.]
MENILGLILVLFFSITASAQLSTTNVLSSNMVLQRGEDVNI